jgi:hypothetical protein
MLPLIDGDIVAYRCAASCEKQGVLVEDFWVAQARSRDLLQRIKQTVSGNDDHLIFLSGSENYRKKINPAYKENRDGVKRPEWLEPLKEWLLTDWGAIMGINCEADDLLGIEQTKDPETRVICTLDKDLRQVPGNHYSWEIQGTVKGKTWIRPEERLIVSPMEGLFNFYWQLVMGDPTDNIFGFDGKGRTKVPKFLEENYHLMQTMSSEEELFNFVRELYNDDERFLMNGDCLWIQRKDEDNWRENVKHLMVENGLKDDSTPS